MKSQRNRFIAYVLKHLKKKVGALDMKIAGTADSKHSKFKCLVNSLYR